MRMINDWTPETKSLIDSLKAAGFQIGTGDNGENEFRFTNVPQFVERLTECDESRFHVTAPAGQKCWLYLVLGNSPGELVCDYSDFPALDAVVEAHYEKWMHKTQPKKEDRR